MQATDTDTPHDLTRAELAEHMHVHPDTVKRRINAGLIAHYRVGRAIRIPFAEFRRIQRDGLPQPRTQLCSASRDSACRCWP